LLFSVRARSFFLQRAHNISLSLSHVRSFVSDGQKRIDGKRERKRERERESYKREFEMTNTSCFSREREREKKKKKKVKNFFFDRERSKKRQKKFIFRRTRFAHVAFAHKVKEKKR